MFYLVANSQDPSRYPMNRLLITRIFTFSLPSPAAYTSYLLDGFNDVDKAQVQPEGAQNSDQRKSLTDTKGSGGLIH